MIPSFKNTKIAFQHQTNTSLYKAKLLFKSLDYKILIWFGKHLLKYFLILPFVKSIIKNTIYAQFVGGETIQESTLTASKLYKTYKIGTILDYAVEGQTNNTAFDNNTLEIIDTLETAKNNEAIPFAVFKFTAIGSAELLEKKQANKDLSTIEKKDYQKIISRAEKICLSAQHYNVPIFIDAEESWIQKEINVIVLQLIQKFNTNNAVIFQTIQFYLKHSLTELEQLIQIAIERKIFLGLKLVRGAYLDKENNYALLNNIVPPVFSTKEATNENYNQAIKTCIENLHFISFCVASHNEESVNLLTSLMEKRQIPTNDSRIFTAQLYGMGNHISFNLIASNYNVIKYIPYGPIKEVIPYLLRRAEENKSVKNQNSRELSLIETEIKRRKKEK